MSLSESLPDGALDPAAAALERVFAGVILDAGLGAALPPDVVETVRRNCTRLAATVIDLTAPYLTVRTDEED